MKDFHFYKTLKIVSFALVFALAFQVIPLGAFAQEASANTHLPTITDLEPERVAEVSYEDESRREETVKHFRMDDGTYSAIEYSVPVHYPDSEGNLKDIDNSLEAVTLEDGTSAYVNKENNFSVTFPDDLSNDREIIISKSGKKISFAVDGSSDSKGNVNNNTEAKKAEKLSKELQKATSETEKAKIRNKYAFAVDKNESTLTYAYNGNIDVEYILIGNKLKENLIIKKQTGKSDFKFKYNLEGLTAELQSDNSVLVKDGDEVVFIIEAPYMFDSAENYSSNITVEIKNKDKGFEYVLHADKDWLKSEDRVYPVTIDPTIAAPVELNASEIKSGTGAKTGLEQDDLDALIDNKNTLKVGYVYGTNIRAVYYSPIPSSIPASARIIGAILSITCATGPKTAFPIYLSEATATWPKDTIALTGTNMPTFSDIEQTYIVSASAGGTYDFDITEIAQRWHCGELANNGIVLHTNSAGTTENFVAFYSNYAQGNLPYYIYTYTDTKGVEGYWSYSTVGLAKGGVASINQFTGYVSAEIPLLSTESELLPFNLSLVYDGYSGNVNTYSLSTCGLGMKLNIDQRIINLDTSSPEYEAGYYYMYRDADGTDIYLKRSYENSVSHDKDELGYGYDATIVGTDWKLLDREDNYVMFSAAGCIKSMYSAEAQASISVTYDPGHEFRISKITDGTGNNLTITRNSSWYVTKISDDFGRYVNFTYTNNLLTKLTYYDGTVVNFTYDTDGMLTTVIGSDNTGVRFNYNEYASTHQRYYLNNRVSSVNEFYKSGSTETAGNSISFAYNSGNSTTITDTNGIKTTYVFDNWGRVTSSYNDYGSAYTDYQDPPDPPESATSKIHQLYKGLSLEKPVNNLLTNHSFESGTTGWTVMSGVSAVTADKYIGYKGVKIVGASGQFRRALQNVTITESGAYTLSAYVKVTVPTGAKKIELIIYEAGNIAGRAQISDTNGDWQRIQLTAILDASQSHIVALAIDDTAATAYFDCVQLESGYAANKYNLLENTTFKNNASSWDVSDAGSSAGSVTYSASDATRPSFITEGYKIAGHYNTNYAITQSVQVNKPASTLAVDLSAYAKASAVPRGLRENVLYSLCIKFVYEDSSGTKVGEELQFVEFNSDSTSWQSVAKPFIPTETWRNSNYNVQYVCVYFQYYRNCNEAEVSNFVLNIDSTGSIYGYDGNGNLTSIRNLKDGKVYTNSYNAANELTSSESDEGGTWNYTYNTSNPRQLKEATHAELGYKISYTYSSNLLTGVELSSANSSKSISSTTNYTGDNNHVSSVIDSAGVTASYNYDTSMERLISIVCGTAQTSYTYDGSTDRPKTVSSKINNSSNATVTYGYDSAKRLSTITRGNTVYTLTYDNWGNQLVVKVGNTALSTNTYESGNGNLIKTTYGNGAYVDFGYDELDRLTSKSINGAVQFTQVYNNSGAISRYNDFVTNTTWEYGYDLIGRMTDITGSNGNIYRYIYDSNNRIGTVKHTIGGNTKSTSYTYNDIGMPSAVSFASNSITNTYDALGRLSKQTLATDGGNNFDTDYTYVDISNDQTTNRLHKLKGVTYEFTNTYDANGNVTMVDENWEKTSDTYVEFTYDSLGQLIGESGSRGSYTVTYDTYGNILTKGGVSYTYGNSSWKDQLTKYGDTTITYDAIGNPNNWRDGMTFGWQNGRQLASVTKDGKTYSFTYDSSGLRTSKKNDNGTPEDETDDITTSYTYVDGKLVHQTDGTNVWFFYYDATDKLVSMEYNGEQYYYVYDSIGNIVILMTYDVLDMAYYRYDAWGKIVEESGSFTNINPFKYKGYYYDHEIGMYYLQSRYYDPTVGRFINADGVSAGIGDSVNGYNLYAYCFNNPVNMVDDTGNWPTWLKNLGARIKHGITIISRIISSPFAATTAEIGAGVGIGAKAAVTVDGVPIEVSACVSVTDSIIYENQTLDVQNSSSASIGVTVANLDLTASNGCEHSYFDKICTCDFIKSSFGEKSNCPANEHFQSTDRVIGVSGGAYLLFGFEFGIGIDIDVLFDEWIDIYHDSLSYQDPY